MAGTQGRVYGGDCNLIHVPDGNRVKVGDDMARELNRVMRLLAYKSDQRTLDQSITQNLCPGCYMVVGFNMLVRLAQQNNQPLVELGVTMANAFKQLAACAALYDEGSNDLRACIEEIKVLMEPPVEAL